MFILPEKSKHSKGFTIIETLVALVVLTMALIPILALTSSINKASTAARDDLIAAGLAQEGIEVVRAIRDTNWYNSRAFDSGLADGDYMVSNAATALTPWSPNQPLKLNDGLYNYALGTATKFYRTIHITKISANELRIVCDVTWQAQSNVTRKISTEEHLFNWK